VESCRELVSGVRAIVVHYHGMVAACITIEPNVPAARVSVAMTKNTDTDQSTVVPLHIGPIWLQPGVTKGHVGTLWVGCFFGIALMTFIGVSQPYILTEHLRIPFDQQGQLAGNLSFFNELVVLALVGTVGAMSDKLGRKAVYSAGFVLMGAGYFLYPLATTPEQLIVFRMIFAAGAACNTAMLSAVANHYPQDKSRGRLLAACFMLNGLGLVLVLRPMSGLPEWFSAQGVDPIWAGRYSLWIITGLCLTVATVLAIGLKPGSPSQVSKREGILATARIGLQAARKPRIALAYVAAFVSRGDLAVVSTFFTLWLVQEGIGRGMSTAEALGRATLFYVVIQAFALPWAAISGYLLDRMNRILGLIIAMFLAAIGYFSLAVIDDPLGMEMYLGAALVGMGEMNANLAAMSLIGQEAPERGRGAVIGVYSFCGALGILTVAKVGGYLFDNWSPIGPFMFVAVGNCLVFALAIFVYWLDRQQSESSAVAGE
jgi:MFS family permease